MPRFFVQELESDVVIRGEDAVHISKALRMKVGERLVICDGKGREAPGEIVGFSTDVVSVKLGEPTPSQSEPDLKVTLYMAWPKGDKAELAVQKAVELGAFEIVFVLTSRCISRPDPKEAAKKLARLQKIAVQAAGQSGRGLIPTVRGMLTFSEALQELKAREDAFLLYEGECPPLRTLLQPECQSFAIFTGCEGGFAPHEIEEAQKHKIKPASLGKRILRCETAPLAALAAVMFYQKQME